MSRFLTFLLGALLGALLGGALIVYLFGGAARPSAVPGSPIKAPEPNGQAPGTAVVVLNQGFFNVVLETIFRDINAPAFPLGLAQRSDDSQTKIQRFALQANSGGCEGKIELKSEGSNVVTGVRLENGQIFAPLAFHGSTSVLGNCLQFTGWAQTNLELRYDETQQTVYGQVNVQTVNLDGVSPFVNPLVTPLVQSSLNQRVNPIQLLKGEQISMSLPIQAAGGTLNARVKDVRSEIKDNALHLYLTYDFNGVRNN